MDTRLIIVLICMLTINIASCVPLFLWSNARFNLRPGLVGHSVTTKELQEDYLEELSKKKTNIAIIALDQLSLDDITKFSGVYKKSEDKNAFINLQASMERQKTTLHLPSVEKPILAVDLWKKEFIGQFHSPAVEDIENLKVSADQNNLILINIPEQKDYRDTLMLSDDVVKRLNDLLQGQNNKFVGIFTARQESVQQTFQDDNAAIKSRHVLQSVETKSEAVVMKVTDADKNTCILASFGNGEVAVVLDKKCKVKFTIQPNNLDSTKSGCSTNTSRLIWKYSENGNNVILRLQFEKKEKTWCLTDGLLTAGLNNCSIDGNYKLTDSLEYDIGSSYVCRGSSLSFSHVNMSGNTYLKMDKFQVQAFMNSSAFGRAIDCIDFFTINILMGVLVSLILVSILAFGLGMIASINSMDRFDDPKGKTIIVAPGE